MRKRSALGLVLGVILIGSACSGGDDEVVTAEKEGVEGETELVGLFNITPGVCDAAGVDAGSYFRMIQPGGEAVTGPHVPNGDSPCGDKTWAPLKAGSEGGLRTGAYQPYTEPIFDEKGNGTASSVTQPTVWFAVTFANGTNEKDPQSDGATSVPTIKVSDGKLSGDLSAYGAAWNKQHFNQGAPKPGGERPGLTAGPTGTYDEATKAYVLDWSSQIAGGPFNNFTGVWHLEGTFEPKE